MIQCVSLHPEGSDRICMGQHWGSRDPILQSLECMLFFPTPLPCMGFSSEVMEGLCNVREPCDEAPIEIAEANELTYCMHIAGWLPLAYSLYLDSVHFKPML